MIEILCADCPPSSYPHDDTRCEGCPRRGGTQVLEADANGFALGLMKCAGCRHDRFFRRVLVDSIEYTCTVCKHVRHARW